MNDKKRNKKERRNNQANEEPTLPVMPPTVITAKAYYEETYHAIHPAEFHHAPEDFMHHPFHPRRGSKRGGRYMKGFHGEVDSHGQFEKHHHKKSKHKQYNEEKGYRKDR